MRARVAIVLEAVGVASGVAAGFTVSATAGLAVACFGLVAFGLAVERG